MAVGVTNCTKYIEIALVRCFLNFHASYISCLCFFVVYDLLHTQHSCASSLCTICFIFFFILVLPCYGCLLHMFRNFASSCVYFAPFSCFILIVLLVSFLYYQTTHAPHISAASRTWFATVSITRRLMVDMTWGMKSSIFVLCVFAWRKRLIMDYEAWFIVLEAWLLIDGSKLSRFVFLGNMPLMCLKHLYSW